MKYEGTHSTRIKDLPQKERSEAKLLLSNWLGVIIYNDN